jgi:hypothetical protein
VISTYPFIEETGVFCVLATMSFFSWMICAVKMAYEKEKLEELAEFNQED